MKVGDGTLFALIVLCACVLIFGVVLLGNLLSGEQYEYKVTGKRCEIIQDEHIVPYTGTTTIYFLEICRDGTTSELQVVSTDYNKYEVGDNIWLGKGGTIAKSQ